MKKEKKEYTIIAIIVIISLLVFAAAYETYRRTGGKLNIGRSLSVSNQQKERSFKDMSYEEILEQYGKEIEEYDIGENNYKNYEKFLFDKKYSKQVSCELKTDDRKTYLFLTNNSDIVLDSVQVSVVYFDTEGNITDISKTYAGDIEPGQEQCYDEYSSKNITDNYKIFINVEDHSSNDNKVLTSKIETDFVTDGNKQYVKLINDNSVKCKYISGLIVFFDGNKNVLGSSGIYYNDVINPGKSEQDDVYVNDDVLKKFTDYKIYITRASEK